MAFGVFQQLCIVLPDFDLFNTSCPTDYTIFFVPLRNTHCDYFLIAISVNGIPCLIVQIL